MKDEGLVYTLLMCLSLAEVRKLWNLRKMFVRVLNDKVVPLLALHEREWSTVRYFLDSGRSGFQYNLDRVFVEACCELQPCSNAGQPHQQSPASDASAFKAVLHTDFEGLRLLAQRRYSFGSVRGDRRLKAFVQEALQKAHVERLSLLRVLSYDISEDIEECRSRGDLAQLLSEGSITVDFLGSRVSFRFPLMDLATTAYAEVQMTDLCRHRETLYKVPFILCAFIKAGASMSSFLRVESCGYLLLLALAAESFNFVYLLVQEAITLEAVLQQYEPYLLQMLRQAMPHRPGVLDLLGFCGFQLKSEDQEQFDASVLGCVLQQDFPNVERISKLGFDLLKFARRQQANGVESGSMQPEEDSGEAKRPQLAIRKFASIDRRVLDLHFQSHQFLEFADDLMGRKAFVQMRRMVEVHPEAFGPYFQKHYQAIEDLLMDAFCRRQISLIVDLASLHLPLTQFLEQHQAQLDAVLHKAWFATKAWTELVMLHSEVAEFRFKSFFLRMQVETDAAVLKIIQDGYWFDLHNLAQLDYDFQDFFHRRFAEVSSAVLQFMTMPHPHFVLLRELSSLDFPWERFMEEHAACILRSKDQDYLQFLISLGSFEVGSKVYRVVEQTCKLYHSMANTMFNSSTAWPSAAPREEVLQAPSAPAVPSTPLVAKASESGYVAGLAGTADGSGADGSGAASSCPAGCDAVSSSAPPVPGTPTFQVAADAILDEGIASEGPSGPKANSAPERAKELARLACERKVDAKKVMALLICRGMYCWNPLKVIMDDADAKDVRSWSQIESVLSFLDAKDEGPGPMLSLQAAQGLQAAGAAQLHPTQPTQPPANAAANPQPQLQTLAQLQSLLQFQQIYQASPWQQQQMVIQIVCLTQRAEEHVFDKKIEFFWRGILDSVLPLERRPD
ncbi:unnamed protein product [Symbiodinium pilosum]|uniref:Uncharacterized protein n=1 Tax=Symbiodinium pilosum TaxID=2952 RepID=A0A812KYP6_SYMPI|nr:unnamed protein product [Symbiodinium pilosum]